MKAVLDTARRTERKVVLSFTEAARVPSPKTTEWIVESVFGKEFFLVRDDHGHVEPVLFNEVVAVEFAEE